MNQEELNIGLTCTGRQSGKIIGVWKGKYEIRYLLSLEDSLTTLEPLTKKWIDRWKADTDIDNTDLIVLSEEELKPYMNKYFAWVSAKSVTIDDGIKTLEEILNDIEDETNRTPN